MCYEKRFDDLEEALEGLHAHFQQRLEAPGTNGSASALCRLRLAVHEWIANLVRHARFGARTPEVHVRLWEQGGQLYCVIEDNSNGFDLESQMMGQRRAAEAAHALPEHGMGLLLIKAGTEHAEYTPVTGHVNRLNLRVTVDSRSR